MLALTSIVVAVAVACFFFRVFFKDLTDFTDCCMDFAQIFGLRFSFGVRNLGFFRFFCYIFLSVGSGFMTHYSLSKYFG
jgi:hypothetical protein